MTSDLLRSSLLLLVLLNPFLLIVYLMDVVEKLERRQFGFVLLRGGLIATGVFWVFAVLGDTVFSDVFQAEFASFQIFGGLVFLGIGVQCVFHGPTAIEMLRGESAHLAGAIAMPLLIGPGTVSASVVIGERNEPWLACAAILAAVVISLCIMIALKFLHDYVRPKFEGLIERYIEITGRVAAFYVGTVAIDMIMRGVGAWIEKI